MPKKQLVLCTIVAAVGFILYYGSSSSDGEHRAASTSETTRDNGTPDTSPATFDGSDCTQDCSGHEAGYAWAQEHDIGDGNACDVAGQHSNSPSFAEGCHAYVDGAADSEDSGDSDSNSEDPGERDDEN